jgi:hypothetical protein
VGKGVMPQSGVGIKLEKHLTTGEIQFFKLKKQLKK